MRFVNRILCLTTMVLTMMAAEAINADFLRGKPSSENAVEKNEEAQDRRLPYAQKSYSTSYHHDYGPGKGRGKGGSKGGRGKGGSKGGRGKGGSKGGRGKGGRSRYGKGKGGGYGGGGYGGGFEVVMFEYFMDPADVAFDIAGGVEVEFAGSKFLWECLLYNNTIRDDVIGTTHGECTRLNDFDPDFDPSTNTSIAFCQFVWTDLAGNSITASGTMEDGFGGTLSITGGNNAWVGAYGEVEIFPLYNDTATMFDLFLDAIGYNGNITFAVPVNSYYGHGY